MKKNIVQLQPIINQIDLEYQIQRLLEDAVYCERFLARPHNCSCPAMYDLIETGYDKEDFGYYIKNLKLRATPKQLSRYEFTIDLLLMIKKDVAQDPIMARRLLWMRASHHKWTKLAKHFGFHRTTLKNKYKRILELLAHKVKKNISFDKLDRIYYRI
jgi:hypothetical protein